MDKSGHKSEIKFEQRTELLETIAPFLTEDEKEEIQLMLLSTKLTDDEIKRIFIDANKNDPEMIANCMIKYEIGENGLQVKRPVLFES